CGVSPIYEQVLIPHNYFPNLHIHTLIKIDHERVLTYVLPLVTSRNIDDKRRERYLRVTAKLGDKRAVLPLVHLCFDKQTITPRRFIEDASFSLEQPLEPSTLAAVASYLNSSNVSYQKYATDMLARSRTQAAITILEEALLHDGTVDIT